MFSFLVFYLFITSVALLTIFFALTLAFTSYMLIGLWQAQFVSLVCVGLAETGIKRFTLLEVKSLHHFLVLHSFEAC